MIYTGLTFAAMLVGASSMATKTGAKVSSVVMVVIDDKTTF